MDIMLVPKKRLSCWPFTIVSPMQFPKSRATVRSEPPAAMESVERGPSEPERRVSETAIDDYQKSGDRKFNSAKDEEDEETEEKASNSRRREDHVTTTADFNGNDLLKAIEVVEKDSLAIAQSYTSLFSSLRSALSQVTSTSIDHMSCFGDAAGCLQECALDSTTKGNRYINSCLRLNEEMKRVPDLAVKLKELRRAVDALDSAVNSTVRLP